MLVLKLVGALGLPGLTGVGAAGHGDTPTRTHRKH